MKKENLNDLKSFKGFEIIDMQNYNLTNEDINFLKNDSLIDLREINLDGNKITNLNFLDKIKSQNLKNITIKNNPINDGILYINENLLNTKIRTIGAKIKNDNHVLSLYYKDNDKYKLYFDYLVDIHKNLDILQQLNL